MAVYTGLRPGEMLALAVEDVATDFSKITVRRSITQSLTFKVPKTKERTVLLQPPARAALKVLVSDATQREPADLTVWLNRHESRIDRARYCHLRHRPAKGCQRLLRSECLEHKWANLIRRAEIRARPPYQTRHTYACWNLTARGNLAFIANQMGHSDYPMLVTVYGRWIDTESPGSLSESGRACKAWQVMPQIAP